jgi:hypothetical protein
VWLVVKIMKNNDETILEILQGHKTSKWPTAKLVKIFIASTKTDFIDERRLLLEYVGPELQTIFDEQKIEVELVDMHFGASEKDTFDAKLFEDHLNEIRMCHKLSRGCFFLSLIGKKYEPLIVPPRLESENFEALLDKVGELGLNCDILENWYFKERNEYILKDCRLISIRFINLSL